MGDGEGIQRWKDGEKIKCSFGVGGTTLERVLVKGEESKTGKVLIHSPYIECGARQQTHGYPTLAALRMSCKSEAGQQHDWNRMQAGMHVPVSGKE